MANSIFTKPKTPQVTAENLLPGDVVNGYTVIRVVVWFHITIVYYYGFSIPSTYNNGWTFAVKSAEKGRRNLINLDLHHVQ